MNTACDDVIRIRIDTGGVVLDFLDELARDAQAGETRRPANPANRAVFRALAPFRLVEYEALGVPIGVVSGVYVGFPDGSICSGDDEICDQAMDPWVKGDPAALKPLYIYVVLKDAVPAEIVDALLAALALHLGQPLVGVVRSGGEGMLAGLYSKGVSGGGHVAARQAESLMAAATETGRHLGKAALLERVSGGAGHGWARLVVNFDPFVMEFSTAHARDDFIAWSERWCDSGETDFRRPAEACDGPSGATFPVIGPNEFGVPPGQDPGLVYWCYLKSVIDAG